MIQTHFLKFISEYCANSWPTFWGDMLPVVETHLQCIFLNIILHKKINNYSNNINSCRKTRFTSQEQLRIICTPIKTGQQNPKGNNIFKTPF